MSIKALYIHIPFCHRICAYCDFAKVIYKSEWADRYLPALFAEISSYNISPSSLETIYIGGGTPTSLHPSKLKELLQFLLPYINKDKEYEFTVEANPEDINLEVVNVLASNGVNRVSLGVQSSKSSFLSLMGRNHDVTDVIRAVSLLKEGGISNISCDFIFGLPCETKDDAIKDAKFALSLGIDHLSFYSLILEEATVFSYKKISEASQEDQAEQYEAILSTLKEAGFERYEVSNFARNGKRSKHNLVYWHDEEYYGCGLGASGYVHGVRYKNSKDLNKYMNQEFVHMEEEVVTPESDLSYFFLTNLRLKDGFLLQTFVDRFSFSFEERYSSQIKKLTSQGLLTIENGRVRPTDKGILLLDQILVELF